MKQILNKLVAGFLLLMAVGATRAEQFSFTEDFLVPPNEANTASNTWQFFHEIDLANRNGGYNRLGFYDSSIGGTTTEGWVRTAEGDGFPFIGVNKGALAVAGVEPGEGHLHPGGDGKGIAIGFRAPSAGVYRLVGTLRATQVGPLNWSLDRMGVTNLAGGTLSGGQSAQFDLPAVSLAEGEFAYLVIDAGEVFSFDTVAVTFNATKQTISRFSFTEDFLVPPNEANTASNTWQFFHEIDLANRNGGYNRLEFYDSSIGGTTTEGWVRTAEGDGFPFIGVNKGALAVAGVEPGEGHLHPGGDGKGIAIGFRAPSAGVYRLVGTLRATQVGPLNWSLDRMGVTNLAGGTLSGGQSAEFDLPAVSLAEGEFAFLVIDAGEVFSFDTVAVTFDAILGSALLPCAAPPAGLGAWWAGENNALDEAGSNAGGLNGGVSFAPGKVGSGFVFDGIDDHIVIPASASVDVGQQEGFTIELWVNPTDQTQQKPLLEWSSESQHGTHLWIGGGVGPFANLIDTNGASHTLTGGETTAGVFQHLALTYDRTGQVAKLYVNGEQVASAIVPGITPQTSYPLILGKRIAPVTGQGAVFHGIMDEISLYARALSQAEIQSIHQAGTHGKCVEEDPSCGAVLTDLVSWWMGDGNGDDQAGLNPGELNEGVSFAPGKVGSGFVFDGIDDHIVVPASASLDVGQQQGFTIELWVNPTDQSQQKPLLEWSSPTYPGVHLWIGGGVGPFANLIDTNGATHTLTGGETTTGVFQHLALTYDRSSQVAKIFVNGEQVASATMPGITPQTSYPLIIGKRIAPVTGQGAVFHGIMDEISLYARALSQAEIQAIHQAGSNGKCASPRPPTILTQPAGGSVEMGQSALLNVIATGSPVLRYQWSKGEAALEGATNATLRLENLQASDAGTYSVRVTNDHGSVTSGNAVIQVFVPSCAAPLSGLAAWWKGEGTGTDQMGTNVAVLSQGISYVPGKVGTAFGFPGAGEFIQLPASHGLDVGQGPGLTVELWIKPSSIATARPLVEWCTDSTHGVLFWIDGSTAPTRGLFASIRDVNGVDHILQSPGDILSTDRFQHVALTYDKASGIGKIYLDGVEVASEVLGQFTPMTNIPLNIGKRTISDVGYGITYEGLMDEVSLYNRALTSVEVHGIVQASGTGKCVEPTPPVIVAQSSDATKEVGHELKLSVIATGSPVLRYQWSKDETALDGATNATLVLENLQLPDTGTYSVTVTNDYGSVTSSNVTLTVVALPPYITEQPRGLSKVAGSTASFSVVAGGTKPLAYQWFFNRTNAVVAATNTTLTLADVSASNAGAYSVVVTNSLGSVTSSVANLQVTFPPAQISMAGMTVISGNEFSIPVRLRANGNENALGFSLSWNHINGLLQFVGVELGSGATGATLLLNESQTQSGRIGIALALPPGAMFGVGTQEVVRVRFNTPVSTSGVRSTSVGFGDQPVLRSLTDVNAGNLPRSFGTGAMITLLPTQLEGDVAPRPNGSGSLTVNDWVQSGRFVAGLDTPASASEFQRADSAPRDTRGDGRLTVRDWVQAGRYAVGLDPLTAVGGPTSLVSTASATLGGDGRAPMSVRELRLAPASGVEGLTVTVPVTLVAQGNENAIGFSLSFDPEAFTYGGILPGSAANGATMLVNTEQAASGRVGVVMALSTGATFPAGSVELAKMTLLAKAGTSGSHSVTFGDQPLTREVSDSLAAPLPAAFVANAVAVNPPPTLSAARAGEQVALTWPLWAEGFALQGGALSGGWTNIPTAAETNGELFRVLLPVSEEPVFFRLRHP